MAKAAEGRKALTRPVRKFLYESCHFSTALRVAARLHLDGMTEKQAAALLDEEFNLPDPLCIEVQNCMRDLERGDVGLDKHPAIGQMGLCSLRELADQLKPKGVGRQNERKR